MLLLVNRCYSEVTWLDDDSGDYSEDHGFIEEGRLSRVADVIAELREYQHLSQCPVTPEWCHGVWASRVEDYPEPGVDSREESIHLKRADGSELSSRNLFRILRAAGLAKG